MPPPTISTSGMQVQGWCNKNSIAELVRVLSVVKVNLTNTYSMKTIGNKFKTQKSKGANATNARRVYGVYGFHGFHKQRPRRQGEDARDARSFSASSPPRSHIAIAVSEQ